MTGTGKAGSRAAATARARRRGALALLLSGVAFPAAAQSTASAAPTSAPRGVGGAASPSRDNITFSIVSRYDSNVARIGDGLTPIVTRAQGDDIRITPSVTLDVARNLGRHQIGLQSSLGYDFYTRNPSLDSERILVNPFVYLDLPVCDLYLSGTARRRRTSLGDIVFLTQPNLDAALDNKETYRRASAQVTCGNTYGLRPGITVEYADGRNSSSLRRIADFSTTRIQPTLSYAGPALGEISLFATRTETDLPNQRSATGGDAGYILRGAGLGYRRAIGSRLTFDGSVSWVELTQRSGTLGSRSGLNGSANLSLVAGPRLQLVAFANRAFNSSLTSSARYELGESYGLTANYAASDRLRLRAGGQVSPRRYFFDPVPTGPFISQQTHSDIFAGASVSLNRRMSLTFDTGYQKRTANVPDFNYENYYAAVGFTFRL